jgi:hypothetical protein
MSLIPGKAGKTAKKGAATLKDKITDALGGSPIRRIGDNGAPGDPLPIERKLTYKHPISGVKLRTPIEHMNPTYEPMGEMLPEKLIHPESLYGGYVIPMRGDPTIAGQRLTGVGGQMFKRPVNLPGGPNFARAEQQVAEGMGWASNSGPSTALSKTAVRLGREGDPVFGAYMKMSPESGDYATHMTETLNQMFKLNPVSPEGQAAFDDIMRRDWGSLNKKTGKYEFPAIPDFPGIANLDDDWINNAGKGRTKIAKLMDSKRFGDMGFPEVGVARHATTEPDLLNTPTNTSGYSVVRFDPSGLTTRNPIIRHPTYDQQNKAAYEGRLPELPLEVLYGPDVMKGVHPSHVSKILETKPPSVKVDQQTLDRVMRYLRSRDGAKWGLGGAVAAGLLSQEQANEMEQPQT